ncbi:hypothetical protein EDD85DRAFT_174204 [Armillaria nabsnona]|nr:hypothetical protein EDD85DRAFT_174204 [Armillaria nabsnona]
MELHLEQRQPHSFQIRLRALRWIQRPSHPELVHIRYVSPVLPRSHLVPLRDASRLSTEGSDKKLQSKILSSFQSPGQPVTAWITRLRWINTLLRSTPYHLRDDELLSCFNTHVNPTRSARYDKETTRECDLIQWISLIKAVGDSLPQPETAAVEDAKKAETPRSSIQTPTRKRSSSSAGNTA